MTSRLIEARAALLKKHDLPIGPLNTVLEPIESISSGNLAIDNAIGTGVPRGRTVELYGPPSSGKTTMALQTAAEAQKRGLNVLYFDYEQALDRSYAAALKLDCDAESFLYAAPDNFEQGETAARLLIETGEIGVVIFDSVAAMTPTALLEADSGQASVAMRARMMSQFLQRLNPLLKNTKTTAIFLNHLMDSLDIGGRPGIKRTTTPGGRALKYYASVRVEFQQIGNIDGMVTDPLSGELVKVKQATNVKVKVVKNKVGIPFRETVVRVRFGRGFSEEWTALHVLVAHKKVKKNGAYFYFDDDLAQPDMQGDAGKKYIQGEANVLVYADTHQDFRDLLLVRAKDIVAAQGGEGLVAQAVPEKESNDPTEVNFVGEDDLMNDDTDVTESLLAD